MKVYVTKLSSADFTSIWRFFWAKNFPLKAFHCTLFENYPKCRIWTFECWHFPLIFLLLKLFCTVLSGNTFWRQASIIFFHSKIISRDLCCVLNQLMNFQGLICFFVRCQQECQSFFAYSNVAPAAWSSFLLTSSTLTTFKIRI